MTPVSASTGLFYQRAKTSMETLASKADTLQTQIATTKRLQAPSDDVVGYQRLQRISRANADSKAWDANLDLSASMLAQADSTVESMGTQIQRATELMVRANNGTLNPTDLKATGAELQAIVQTLAELANTRDMRGQPLFGGTDGQPAVTVTDGVPTYSEGTPAPIPVGDGQQVQSSELASRLFDLGEKDTLVVLQELATTLLAGEMPADDGGDVAITDLNAAGEQLTTMRASLGARAARVDILQAQSTEIAADRETERSTLEDTDLTAAIADLQKTMTVLSATQASFSKLSQLSLFDYLR